MIVVHLLLEKINEGKDIVAIHIIVVVVLRSEKKLLLIEVGLEGECRATS